MLKLRQLESALSSVEVFRNPKWNLEQYPTSPELASHLLHAVVDAKFDDLQGKRVADLGTGTGMLALGALLMGASSVLAVDVDEEALLIAKENLEELYEDEDEEELERRKITFLLADVIEETPPWQDKTTSKKEKKQKKQREKENTSKEDSDSDEEDEEDTEDEEDKSSKRRGGRLSGRGRGGQRGRGGSRGGRGGRGGKDNRRVRGSDDEEEGDDGDEEGQGRDEEEAGRPLELLETPMVDTVIMNPPFGTKNNQGVDVKFLRRGLQIAQRAVYSFHKSSTRKACMKEERCH